MSAGAIPISITRISSFMQLPYTVSDDCIVTKYINGIRLIGKVSKSRAKIYLFDYAQNLGDDNGY